MLHQRLLLLQFRQLVEHDAAPLLQIAQLAIDLADLRAAHAFSDPEHLETVGERLLVRLEVLQRRRAISRLASLIRQQLASARAVSSVCMFTVHAVIGQCSLEALEERVGVVVLRNIGQQLVREVCQCAVLNLGS